jgi:hypothetical protein
MNHNHSFVFNHGNYPTPADVVIDVDTLAITTDIDGELNDVDIITFAPANVTCPCMAGNSQFCFMYCSI